MRPPGKITAALAAVALLAAACTAASHSKALSPSGPPPSPAGPPVTPGPRPPVQLGADIDLYTYPGQDFLAASQADVAWLRAHHINSVSVSFPFFMTGPDAAGVQVRQSTPTPSQLAVFAVAAERAGLFVSIRPLLNEAGLRESRVTWQPRDPAAWFASYQRFLLPYAQMAQATGIQEMFTGAEFTAFGTDPHWRALTAALRHVYHGALAYANNGNRIPPGDGGGVLVTADAYPSMSRLGARPPLAALTHAWAAYDRTLPRGTVLSEVGIDAIPGAYARPWTHHWRHGRVSQAVQTRWFTAACRAAIETHLGGIYFWPIGFGRLELAARANPRGQGQWSGGPAAAAVSACYAARG